MNTNYKSIILSTSLFFALSAPISAAPGDLDPTFGNGGIVITRPSRGDLDYSYAMAIQSDGKIVVVGEGSAGSFNWDFAVLRYNPDGTLDTSFGGPGTVSIPIGIASVAIQSDGKIVAAGGSNNGTTYDFAVVRLNPNGTLDSSFGSTGKTTVPVGNFGSSAHSVAIQTNGKIVVSGSASSNDIYSDFAVVRLNPNGSLDTTFNGTGKVITPVTPGNDIVTGAAIQADGKIVVAGMTEEFSDFYTFAVVRYLGDAPSASCSSANPIDCADFFIGQQYRDFLGREPDSTGFANWMATLTGCPNGGYGEFDNPHCDRVHVSAGFVHSHEFQGRGYWILRFGYIGLNRSIGAVKSSATYAEFIPALAQVGGSNSPAQEEAAKVAYANAFVQRQDFLALFPTTMTASQYVNALESNAQVTLSNKQALIDALNAGTISRADVLRNVVESQVVFDKYLIPAFVTMEYFGYLRRDPDLIGYQNWVNTLTANPNDYRHMIFGFIYSTEYRARFGSP